jgi:hypothetical protein
MHSGIRVALAAALAFATITCAEGSAPTAPSEGLVGARVALTLTFSPQAAQAFALLGRSENAVTELRVRVTAVGGTALDTVFAAPSTPDSLRLDLPLRIRGTEQSLASTVDLRTADHSVLFSASQTIVARAANLPALPSQALALNYTGPGSSATTLILSARDTTVQGSVVVTYAATARDAANAPLSDVLVLWTSSDTSIATVTASGARRAQLRSSGKRGTTTLTGSTPLGVSASVRVSVLPMPTQIVIVSGGAQSGVAGSALAEPLVIEVRAADGLPVPGTPVTFRATTPGASVMDVSTVTDATGRASAAMVLGRTSGAYQFEVSASGLTLVSVTQSASASPPAALSMISGDGQADSLGSALPLPLVVKVVDRFGLPSEGQTVLWNVESGSGTLASATSTTGPSGTASNAYTLGNRPGNDVVTATVPGLGGSSSVSRFSARTIARGVADVVIVSGGAQSAEARTTLPSPLVVSVNDALGSPIPGMLVVWNSSAGATVTPATGTTNASGQASASIIFGSTAGSVTVTCRASNRSVSSVMTVLQPAPASIAGYQNYGVSLTVGSTTTYHPTVIVKDAGGYPVPNAPVSFSVEANSGSITGATTTTDSNGVAGVGSWTLDTLVHANWLDATTGALSTRISDFGVAGPVTRIVTETGPARLAVGGRADFLFQLQDRYGNYVFQAGTPVVLTWSAGSNGEIVSLTTNAGGFVQYTINPVNPPAGIATFTMTSPGLPTNTFSLPVVSGGAYAIHVGASSYTYSAVLGMPIAPAPVVQIVATDGSVVRESGHVVTALIGGGSGTLTGTLTRVTDVDGRASFPDLIIGGPLGFNYIHFTSPGLVLGIIGVSVSASLPSSLVVIAGNNQTAVAGTPVTLPPAVRISGTNGDPIAGAWVFISIVPDEDGVSRGELAINNGQLGSSVTMLSDTLGIVRLDRWTVSTSAGHRSIAVTSQFNFPTQYVTATVLPGPGSQLKFMTPPSPSATTGVALPSQPVVQLLDAHGNDVKAAGVVITAAITSGSGTLTNAMATTDANGIATFSALRITRSPGDVVLVFSVTGYALLRSATIRVD